MDQDKTVDAPEAQEETAPIRLQILGCNTFPHRTRQLRRNNGFGDRKFYIGDLIVRPTSRISVNLEFCGKYFDEIVKRIQAGNLMLQSNYDKFITPAELAQLLGMDVAVEDSDELKSLNATLSDPGNTDPPAPPANDPPSPPADPELKDHLEPPASDPESTAEEGSAEPDAQPEAASTPVEPEPVQRQARELPAGYEGFNKDRLTQLCSERGIEFVESDVKKVLVQRLTDWVNG